MMMSEKRETGGKGHWNHLRGSHSHSTPSPSSSPDNAWPCPLAKLGPWVHLLASSPLGLVLGPLFRAKWSPGVTEDTESPPVTVP